MQKPNNFGGGLQHETTTNTTTSSLLIHTIATNHIASHTSHPFSTTVSFPSHYEMVDMIINTESMYGLILTHCDIMVPVHLIHLNKNYLRVMPTQARCPTSIDKHSIHSKIRAMDQRVTNWTRMTFLNRCFSVPSPKNVIHGKVKTSDIFVFLFQIKNFSVCRKNSPKSNQSQWFG